MHALGGVAEQRLEVVGRRRAGGGGDRAHRGRRLAEALLGGRRRRPVVDRARAGGDDREDLRLELLHLHVDDADQAQVVRLERGQLRAQRRVLVLDLREPVAQRAQARPRTRSISRPRMRSPSTRSPLWSYSLVTQPCRFGVARRRSPRRTRARRRGPRCRSRPRPGPCWRASTSGSYSRGQSTAASSCATVARRRQRAVVLEQPREDVLAGEQLGLLVEDRPAASARADQFGDAAVGPARLVQQRVDRVAGDPELVGARRAGTRASPAAARAGSAASPRPSLMPSLLPCVRSRRAVSGRRRAAGRRGGRGAQQRPHPLAILREALVVAAVALDHPRPRGAVDVVDRHADPRHAAGDERLAQPVGRERQVRERRRSPPKLWPSTLQRRRRRAPRAAARRRARSSRRGSASGTRRGSSP